VKRTWK